MSCDPRDMIADLRDEPSAPRPAGSAGTAGVDAAMKVVHTDETRQRNVQEDT